MLNGEEESSPIFDPFAKNSTSVTEPSGSLAFALNVIGAGRVVLLVGLVMLTVGGLFILMVMVWSTAMLIGCELVCAPSLSVATATML